MRGITHQLRGDLAALRDAVAELSELCQRYQFAYYREWALILDGWSRPGRVGHRPARRGIANLRAAGAFARMPYWLALLADLCARDGQPGAARATLDAALAAARRTTTGGGCPRCCGCGPRYDERAARHDPAAGRSRAGVEPGQRRAAAAVRARPAERGVPAASVLPEADRRARERCANGAGPSFVRDLTVRAAHPEGNPR